MVSLRKFFSKSLVGIVSLALIAVNLTAAEVAHAEDNDNAVPNRTLSYNLSYPEDSHNVDVTVLGEGLDTGESITLVKGDQPVESKNYNNSGTVFSITPPVSGVEEYKLIANNIESNSFQIGAGVNGYSLSLSTSAEVFATNEATPQITWTTNTSLNELNNYYGIFAYDKETGAIFYRTDHNPGNAGSFSINRFFYSSQKEFGVAVAKQSQTSNYINLTEVQVESSITISRKPFDIQVSPSKSSFKNGETPPLINVSSDQIFGYHNEPWNYYLVEIASNTIIGKTFGDNGIFSFSTPPFIDSPYRDYKVVIADFNGANVGDSASVLQNIQQESTQRISREEWSVSLEISSPEYSSTDPTPTVTATANQFVGGELSFFILDETNNRVIAQSGGQGDQGIYATVGIERFEEDTPRTYSAYVAKKMEINWGQVVTREELLNVQAVSSTVSTQRKPWEIAVEISRNSYMAGDSAPVVVTANANQQTNGKGVSIYVVDVESGSIIGSQAPWIDQSVTTEVPLLYQNEERLFRAYIADANQPSSTKFENITGIRAASETLTLTHTPWDAEYTISGFSNAASLEVWPAITLTANQSLARQNYFCYVLTDATTGEILNDTSDLQYDPTVKIIKPPYFWDTTNKFLSVHLVICNGGEVRAKTNIDQFDNLLWSSEIISIIRAPWQLDLYSRSDGTFTAEANQKVFSPLAFYLANSDGIVTARKYYPDWWGQYATNFEGLQDSDGAYAYLALEGTEIGSSVDDLQLVQAISGLKVFRPDASPPVFGHRSKDRLANVNYNSELLNCTNSCAGDPINTFSGEFYESNVDLSISGVQGIEFTRNYSTTMKDNNNSKLGLGWSHNFNRRIEAKDPNYSGPLNEASELLITANNGSKLPFFKDGESYVSYAGVKGELKYNQTDEKFELNLKDNRQIISFDGSNGKLYSITDPNGNAISFSYDSAGRLNGVNNGTSQALNISYNSQNLISSVSDGVRTVTYSYDSNKRLIAVNHPLALEQTYQYDTANRVVSMTNISGGTTTNEFDNENRVVKQIDPRGGILTIGYNR